MTDITPERLAEIKALADKATAGPWQTTFGTTESLLNPYRQSCRENAVLIDGRHLLNLWGTPNPDENAAFIAAARQDIPDLIASLEAAQAKLEESILTRTQDGSIAWGRIKDLERENSTFRHALQQIAQQKLASEVEDTNKADFRKWHEYSVELARFRLEAKP